MIRFESFRRSGDIPTDAQDKDKDSLVANSSKKNINVEDGESCELFVHVASPPSWPALELHPAEFSLAANNESDHNKRRLQRTKRKEEHMVKRSSVFELPEVDI